ncbi:MAG: glycerophosphodiester phosphodiesterase [Candidatus Thorarchaeota archaeon]
MKNDNKVLIMAHRGASSIAPENTLKAFQKAIELNADYIEFDVYKSKDGEFVIWHDNAFSQKDGETSFIKDMTLANLKKIDIGEGETFTTLQELIELTKGKIGLNCEIKAQNIGKDIVGILKKENLTETTILSSFIFNELVSIKKLDSTLKLGLILTKDMISPRWVTKFCKKAINNNFFAIHPFWRTINKDIVEFAHSNGLLVNIWTYIYEPIKDSDLREVVKMGIDGLIHDDIQQAKRVIGED